MANLIGAIFRKHGKVHYFNAMDIELKVADKVIVRTDEAIEITEVVTLFNEVEDEEAAAAKKIIRKATYYDLSVDEINKDKEKKGYKKFEELSAKYKLPMKLVDIHIFFDKSKMVFYFTSDKRVDFREMVKELAASFKLRIELRQIGVRDEAKIIGGLGPCGMKLCCKSFLTDFESISVKMAKDQNLPLNPLKISGICGRLMCCLKYEYECYSSFLDTVPERGIPVKCSFGKGTIYGYEPLKKKIVVELDNETKVSVNFDEIEVIEGAKKEIIEEDVIADD